jgi:hypothetical protein
MALLLLLAFGLFQDAPAPKPDPAVTRADIERTIAFLASDELKGRDTGTEEAMRAADFLAQALAAAGVQPAGDGGTFLQGVPMTSTTYRSLPKLTSWNAKGETSELVMGVDFDWVGGVPTTKRLRVRPVTKDEEMMSFTDDEVALFLDVAQRDRRRLLGSKRGAGFGLILSPGTTEPGLPDTTPPSDHLSAGDAASAPPVQLSARGKFLEALRAGDVKAVRIECDVKVVPARAANVVGVIRGVGTQSAPKLADQVVVLSAHYDHIGDRAHSAKAGEDAIYNGADDDASGCAAVIELAQAFGAGPPPARTLVFFLATGEEIGLVGTNFYIDVPFAPLERTVCNLNFEMIGRADPKAGGAGKLWLTGDERSNLGAEFRALGLSITVDPHPEQHFFERSDNIAFARRGIVAQTLSSYNLHKDYHTVRDEIALIEFDHMVGAVRASVDAVRAIADGRIEPKWNPGGNPAEPAPKSAPEGGK